MVYIAVFALAGCNNYYCYYNIIALLYFADASHAAYERLYSYYYNYYLILFYSLSLMLPMHPLSCTIFILFFTSTLISFTVGFSAYTIIILFIIILLSIADAANAAPRCIL